MHEEEAKKRALDQWTMLIPNATRLREDHKNGTSEREMNCLSRT